jgi:hypothetical protein
MAAGAAGCSGATPAASSSSEEHPPLRRPPCHRSASSGAVRGWGPPPAPTPLSPFTRSSRRSPHPRRCCSRRWRCVPPPGRRSTVPISPTDASAALGPGVRAPAQANDNVRKCWRRKRGRSMRDVDPRPTERGADWRRGPRWWRRGLQRRLDDGVAGVPGEEPHRRHAPSGGEGPRGVAIGERAPGCSSRPVHPWCRTGRWRPWRGWRSAVGAACYR